MNPITRTLIFGALVVAALPAAANERHWAYTYETATLPKGVTEIEPWTTVKLQKKDYFARIENRLEFEMGLHDKLQLAAYINTRGTFALNSAGTDYAKSFEFRGVSLELKGKLLDAVADPIGLGLYFELTGMPHEAEFEFKLLLDKRVGNFHFAFNAVYEQEMEGEYENGELETEHTGKFEFDLGLGYFITPNFSLGLELRNTNLIEGYKEFTHSTLFAGLTAAYSTEKFWLVFSVLPQIAAFKGATHGPQNLAQHERVETRLLLGFHL